jgi:hypothetical protein
LHYKESEEDKITPDEKENVTHMPAWISLDEGTLKEVLKRDL